MPIETSHVKSIFHAAIEFESTEDRSAYLDEACRDQPKLRSEIESLLAAHVEDDGFISQFIPAVTPTADSSLMGDLIGSHVGPYVLREQIGEGGMGVVYVAEQAEPLKRKVALKIIKPGMASDEVVARFQAERQALAMMDHPHIAQVYDGGVTESDRPFFVMELVHGVAITDFCDHYQLSVKRRLPLFIDVCRAIQHAHQKGIIHRDVKPSNVLVTLHDDQPVVKVIDFGIAKAIDQEHVQQTMYTRFAQMVGTPTYMSPEQAELRPLGVDTRTDVYSLGVLLYELFTGLTPISKEDLGSASYDELRRKIREEEPLRPSARVSTLQAAQATTVADGRRTEPVKLSQQLSGELDAIVIKCLEKDRSRRYETASALADDVQRFLENEPILARSPSAACRFHKFVRRNRALVASLASVFVALSLGAAVATFAFLHARQQRDLARQQSDLAENRLATVSKEQENNRVLIELLRDMYPTPWGMQTFGRNHTVYDSIERISPTLETRLQGHPEVQVKVRQIFAEAYTSARQFDKARDHRQKALKLAEKIYAGAPHITVAELHAALADEVGSNFGAPLDFGNLLEHAEKAIEMNESLGIDSERLACAYFAKALCLLSTAPNRKAEAEQAQRKVVEICERIGQSPVISLWDLGLILMELGDDRLDDAQVEFEKALQRCQNSSSPPMHRVTVLSGLGQCLLRKGDLAAAIDAFHESWTLCQANDELKNEPRGYRQGFLLVETYFAQGDLQNAFAMVRQLEEQLRTTKTSSVESLADCLFLKGWLHFQLENYTRAAGLFEESMQIAKEHLGDRSTAFAGPCIYLGLTCEALQQTDDAEDVFRQVLPITEPFVEASPSYTTIHWSHPRALHAVAGDDKRQLEEALRIVSRGHAFVTAWPHEWMEPAFHLVNAKLRRRLGDSRETTIEVLENGIARAQEPRATFRSSRWQVPTTRTELERMLVGLFKENGNTVSAKQVLADGVRIRGDALGEDHIQVAMAQLRLGEFLTEQSEFAAAEPPLLAAYEKLNQHPNVVDHLRHRATIKLVELYTATDRPETASKWQTEAEETRDRRQP